MSSSDPSLDRWLRGRLSTFGDATLEIDGRAVSYAQLDAASDRLAVGLQLLGIGPGTPVGVMVPTSLTAIHLWFALVKAGAIEVPIDPGAKGVLLEHVIGQSQVEVVVGTTEALGSLRLLAERHAVRHVIVDGPGPAAPARPGWTTHRLDDLYVDGTPTPHGRTARDAMVVMYTSGTTGPPKGVTCSHTWALELVGAIARATGGYSEQDNVYSVFPTFYMNARYAGFLPALDVGADFLLDARFSASTFWDTCRRKEISVFNYLGAVIPILWKQERSEDDADNPVRLAFGAACPPELWVPFEERFGLRIVEGYGLTEAPLVLSNAIHDRRPGSCGRPVPDWYQVELHDEAGRPVAPGETGEAVVRPCRPGVIFRGYFNAPAATVEAWRDLWFHTGDRLRQDEDGYFYFVDRIKESIRRRGKAISSWEVEQVVNRFPGVLESAAYAVPSELAEDEVMVAVVPREGQDLDPRALVEHCRGLMATFAVPRYVRVLPSLPKTPSARVQKFALRDEGIAPGTFDAGDGELGSSLDGV